MAKNSKWFVVLIVLVAVGFVSYRAGQKSVVIPDNPEERVKNELVELTQEDFEEYQNLKSLEDRYKKADEILGKIVTVFLADLGLRLGYKPTQPALLDTACSIPPVPPPVAASGPQPSPVMSSETSSPEPEAKKTKQWTDYERTLMGIRDEATAFEALRKMEVPDLFSGLKNASKVGRDDVLLLDGHYDGEISFLSRQDHKSDWTMRMEINVRNAASNNVTAATFVTLTDKANGKTFSRTRGGGNLKDFMKIPGSKAIFVDVYGNDGYVQIYPLNGNPSVWVGNYYEKTGLGTFRMSGQVRLIRQAS